MSLSRREFLGRAAAAAFASAGAYGLIDQIAKPVRRESISPDIRLTVATTPSLPLEQHLYSGLSRVTDNGAIIVVPPLHHMVVTATLTVPPAGFTQAQEVLETAIAGLETSGLLDFTPSGMGLAVAWGLPYFNRLPSALANSFLPVDVVASRANGHKTLAVIDAIGFPSDSAGTLLEGNDVAFVMASDSLANLTTAQDAIFNGPPGALMTVTSIRRGFVDGHQIGTGTQSLTKQMAMAAKIPRARAIPNSAELFLGFTSTQELALGSTVIANLETLPGLTDQWLNGYFRHGTTMHLSHIFEDLKAWYGTTFKTRAGSSSTPSNKVPHGTLTIPEGPTQVEALAQVQADIAKYGYVGHSSSMQPASRLHERVVDNYGIVWPPGTAIPQRADFNTLDNPFAFSSNPQLDQLGTKPAAGVHFLSYMPTSSLFHRVRNAMDGQYDNNIALGTNAVHGPFNSVLQATHRQNYLVPPEGTPLVPPGRTPRLTPHTRASPERCGHGIPGQNRPADTSRLPVRGQETHAQPLEFGHHPACAGHLGVQHRSLGPLWITKALHDFMAHFGQRRHDRVQLP